MNQGSITVIAEIGENHLGNWALAKQMIDAAVDAGADIVKFQSYLGAEVQPGDPEKDWFTEVEVTDEVHFELKEYTESKGVEFLSSPFSLSRAKFLVEELKMNAIKVASSEMRNFGMLDYLNGKVDTVYLSTGLSTLEEVKESVSHLADVEDVCVMQCTTAYPCPDELANLGVIQTYLDAFPDRRVGFSDHTLGTLASIAAAAMGVSVIEKHFTLSKLLPGTDHVLSATPDELQHIAENVKRIGVLRGSAEKTPVGSEKEIIEFVRTRFVK
jgi:sialic acid synthase SpsE